MNVTGISNSNTIFTARRPCHSSRNLQQATEYLQKKCFEQFGRDGAEEVPSVLHGTTKVKDGTIASITISADFVKVFPEKYTNEVIGKLLETIRNFQTKGKYSK